MDFRSAEMKEKEKEKKTHYETGLKKKRTQAKNKK